MKALRTYLHVVLCAAIALALMAPAVAASPSCARACAGERGAACCAEKVRGGARHGGCCAGAKTCGTHAPGKRGGGCCAGNAETCPCCPQLVPGVLPNVSMAFLRVGVVVESMLTVPICRINFEPPLQPPRA